MLAVGCVIAGCVIPWAGRSATAAETTPLNLAPPQPRLVDTNLSALWFPVGEHLRYRICWGVLHVGEIQATSSWVTVEGRRLLELTCRARSNHVLRWVYPVDDKVVSTIDPVSFLPVTFEVDMHAGKHVRQERTTFDYTAGRAVWTALNKPKAKTCPIDPNVRDLLSLLYYMRKEEVFSGTNLTLRAMINAQVGNLPVTFTGRETVNVPGRGNVACLRLTPKIDFEVTFHKPSSITLWISADQRKICTRAQIQVPVGSITAELVELSGPGTEQWPAAAKAP